MNSIELDYLHSFYLHSVWHDLWFRHTNMKLPIINAHTTIFCTDRWLEGQSIIDLAPQLFPPSLNGRLIALQFKICWSGIAGCKINRALSRWLSCLNIWIWALVSNVELQNIYKMSILGDLLRWAALGQKCLWSVLYWLSWSGTFEVDLEDGPLRNAISSMVSCP